METFSIEELKLRAQGVIEKNGLKEVYVTEDGQVFFDENRAYLHASGQMKVYTFKREGKAKNEVPKDESADSSEGENTKGNGSWFKSKK